MTQNQIWFLWAINLLAQNFMFTFVSRARNSGSLRRHVVAAIGSNGVWMLQFQLMMGPLMEYLNGKHGFLAQVCVGAYYTLFTVAGSVLAHYWALRTEAGKSAVGASSKYVQITPEMWAGVVDSIQKCAISTEVADLRGKMASLEVCADQVRSLEAKAQKLVDDWGKLDYGAVLRLSGRK